MSSPIRHDIQGIFIHVQILDRSTAWYGRLLDLPIRDEDRFDHVHVFKMKNGTDLVLDSKGFVPRRGDDVLFMFDTGDIDAAHRFVVEHDIEVARPIEHAGPVSFFSFKDPDGNILMVCQQHR